MPTTPQQRSELARRAAQIRRFRAKRHCERSEAIPLLGNPQNSRHSKLTAQDSWLENRFCLRLEQDPAGDWCLLTPAGLRISASPGEISLWLDLQAIWLDIQTQHSQNPSVT